MGIQEVTIYMKLLEIEKRLKQIEIRLKEKETKVLNTYEKKWKQGNILTPRQLKWLLKI